MSATQFLHNIPNKNNILERPINVINIVSKEEYRIKK